MGNNVKSIFASRTFWFNVVAGVVGFAQSNGLFTLIPDPYGPPLVALINLGLRAITTQPVSVSGS